MESSSVAIGRRRFYFLRHGESANNSIDISDMPEITSKKATDGAKSKCNRVPDPPLTERGMSQAKDAAEWLLKNVNTDKELKCGRGISVIVTSPMLRAVQTAQQVQKKINVPMMVHPLSYEVGALFEGPRIVPSVSALKCESTEDSNSVVSTTNDSNGENINNNVASNRPVTIHDVKQKNTDCDNNVSESSTTIVHVSERSRKNEYTKENLPAVQRGENSSRVERKSVVFKIGGARRKINDNKGSEKSIVDVGDTNSTLTDTRHFRLGLSFSDIQKMCKNVSIAPHGSKNYAKNQFDNVLNPSGGTVLSDVDRDRAVGIPEDGWVDVGGGVDDSGKYNSSWIYDDGWWEGPRETTRAMCVRTLDFIRWLDYMCVDKWSGDMLIVSHGLFLDILMKFLLLDPLCCNYSDKLLYHNIDSNTEWSGKYVMPQQSTYFLIGNCCVSSIDIVILHGKNGKSNNNNSSTSNKDNFGHFITADYRHSLHEDNHSTDDNKRTKSNFICSIASNKRKRSLLHSTDDNVTSSSSVSTRCYKNRIYVETDETNCELNAADDVQTENRNCKPYSHQNQCCLCNSNRNLHPNNEVEKSVAVRFWSLPIVSEERRTGHALGTTVVMNLL